MGKLVKKLTFAIAIFTISNIVFGKITDFLIWFTDEDQTQRYLRNQQLFDILYDIILPYFLASFVTLRYIKKVFYIPTIGESVRWLLSFIFFSWGWVLIQYFFLQD